MTNASTAPRPSACAEAGRLILADAIEHRRRIEEVIFHDPPPERAFDPDAVL